MTETFYDLLGVADDASTEEIETAYREAIKRVHPDVSDDVDAGERTKRLNEAKRVLTDEDERARYDRLGHETYTGESPSGSSTTPNGRGHAAGSARTSGAGTSSDSDQSGSTRRDSTGRWSEWAAGSQRRGTGETDRPGESTWRGSQQRGRRSGRRRESRGRGRRWEDGSDAGRTGPTGGRGTERAANDGAGASDGAGNGDTGSAAAGSGVGRSNGGAARAGGSTARSPGDGTTRSRGDSTGPAWQSSGTAADEGSPSAQRQAAAGSTDGPNADWSWNAWQSTGAWAVRQGSERTRRLRPSRLFPKGQSLVILGSIFFLYPFFVGSVLYPRFPLAARVAIAVCTLLTFAYLLSIPEAAIAIYGLWSVLVPVVLIAVPGVSLFSLVGVVGLVATWVPLGLSVLTYSLVRP
ncbi:DnaJ domain-containing protein [Halosimplex aquaticum]|uniref:DnaJ domain-containing protein n=1 Tax=Halosimplex aquaticum TaxID=3026162 RepID=A0ABD5XSW1_9EURY|nr:DnaJ domain-containing protein [Halosimplex aquaticum]